jgi:hypothetical protein
MTLNYNELVDKPARCRGFLKYLWNQILFRIRIGTEFLKRQGYWCKVLGFSLEFGFIFIREMAWTGCRTVDWLSIYWTCDGKNSSEFERAVVVMHGSSSWMLGEEEGLFEHLTGHSLERQSDGFNRVANSGSSSDLSSDKSEFLYNRNPKKQGE